MAGGEKIRSLLLNNMGFKLSAFFLALVIWFYFFSAREGISFRRGATSTFNVPVQILDSMYPFHSVRIIPDTSEIVVKGSRDALSELSPDDFRVFVEVKGLRKGEYLLPVRVFVTQPVEIISRNPRNIKVIIGEKWTPTGRD